MVGIPQQEEWLARVRSSVALLPKGYRLKETADHSYGGQINFHAENGPRFMETAEQLERVYGCKPSYDPKHWGVLVEWRVDPFWATLAGGGDCIASPIVRGYLEAIHG